MKVNNCQESLDNKEVYPMIATKTMEGSTLSVSLLLLLLPHSPPVLGFTPSHLKWLPPTRRTVSSVVWRNAQVEGAPPSTGEISLQPVFDFSDSIRNETDRFERIDDVIMGGISSSTLRQVDGEPFARWSGVCREDGGYVLQCVRLEKVLST